GGSIKIQGGGLMVFETAAGPAPNGPIISALGGAANLTPTADFEPNGIIDYAGNGLTTAGGTGSVGRIRIESSIGFNTLPPTNCGTSIITYTAPNNRPTVGICPPPVVFPFEAGTQLLSTASTLTYNASQAGGVRNSETQFAPPTIGFLPFVQPAGTAVRVLFEGARESLDTPGRPGPFAGMVDDPAALNGAEYIRMHFQMYSSGTSFGVPTLDRVALPISFPAN
ncbi:MAG: hypothetical protein L0Z55_00300, partial [Planctomycetes bacterium]|nr:hypothetical protein [Planctomycetota bacterium]